MRRRPIKVKDKTTGKIVELVPEKVWTLAPRGKRPVKIGIFRSPETKVCFRARVPDDYPEE